MEPDYIDVFLNTLKKQKDKRLALQEFCRQYHYFSVNQILAFSKMSLRYSQLDLISICEISKTVYEEYGSGNPARIHSVLFEKMAYACGVKKGELPQPSQKILPAIKKYIQNLDDAFSTGTLAQALSAYVFLETTAVKMYPKFLTALESMGFNEDELDFFSEHANLEPKHLATAIALVENQHFSPTDQQAYESQFLILDKSYREFWNVLNQALMQNVAVCLAY